MDNVERLTELLRRVNREGPAGGAREEAKTVLAGVDPAELSRAEQNLLAEGLDPQALRNVCALHLEVLNDQLAPVRAGLAPGHVLDTFYREHDQILRFLDILEAVAGRLRGERAYDPAQSDYGTLRAVTEHLVGAEKHHAREEEVLFPELERRGIDGPPRVMRFEHVELRAQKARLLELAQGVGGMNFTAFQREVNDLAASLIFQLRDHIFKENTILYPTALEVIPKEAWDGLKKSCDDIGYCCFTP